MTTAQKWDPVERVYHAYEMPDDWRVATYESDMNAIVNCAQCGREMRFGDGYTSREVHTPVFGMGYIVCEECYEAELKRERKAVNA